MTLPHRLMPARLLLGISLLLGIATAVHAAAANNFDPVAATEALLNMLPADQRAKSDAYFEGGYWLLLWSVVVPAGLTWIMLKFGWTQKIRDLAERGFKGRFMQGLLFVILLSVLNWVLTLPWDYYTGFVREHQYDLSNLSAAG